MYKAQAAMKETYRKMTKKYNQGVLGGCAASGVQAEILSSFGVLLLSRY